MNHVNSVLPPCEDVYVKTPLKSKCMLDTPGIKQTQSQRNLQRRKWGLMLQPLDQDARCLPLKQQPPSPPPTSTASTPLQSPTEPAPAHTTTKPSNSLPLLLPRR